MQDLSTLPPRGIVPFFAGGFILLFTLKIVHNYRRILQSIQHHPGIRQVLSVGILTNFLPHIPGVSLGRSWGMRLKHTIFAKAGWDVITAVNFYPKVAAEFIVADPLAAKDITMRRSRFPKPVEDYGIFSSFGKNIIVTESDEWKLHRKITAPAFSEKNNKLVWDETIRIVTAMFEKWGMDNAEVPVDHALDFCMQIALLVISVAGFGRRITWEEDTYIPTGHKLSFKDSIHTVSSYIHIKLLTPNWMYPFSKFLTHVKFAFEDLESYMLEMIDVRKLALVKEERYDLFSALLDASEGEKEDVRLNNRDLIGNIFIFLLAGHETTAHTLCFAMGLLALEHFEQEKLYRQIISVVPDGETPSYEQMNMLPYCLAVFYETLRLYPPVSAIPKRCAEDTTIPAIKPDGSRGVIVVPKDARVQLNTTGLHFNPRYWPEPETFRPSRFLGDWPKDAFLSFSGGPRACLGRKFSETEGVAVLTMIVRRYRIELKNPELYEGLTHAEKRAKLLANFQGITTTPVSVPLVFKKR